MECFKCNYKFNHTEKQCPRCGQIVTKKNKIKFNFLEKLKTKKVKKQEINKFEEIIEAITLKSKDIVLTEKEISKNNLDIDYLNLAQNSISKKITGNNLEQSSVEELEDKSKDKELIQSLENIIESVPEVTPILNSSEQSLEKEQEKDTLEELTKELFSEDETSLEQEFAQLTEEQNKSNQKLESTVDDLIGSLGVTKEEIESLEKFKDTEDNHDIEALAKEMLETKNEETQNDEIQEQQIEDKEIAQEAKIENSESEEIKEEVKKEVKVEHINSNQELDLDDLLKEFE